MRRSQQRGVTMLVVLVLLSVMLLGGMALARMTEVGTLVAGNVAFKDRALQASEVGMNTAFQRVRVLANEEADSGSWYYASMQAQTAEGIPSVVDWTAAPEVTVGPYSVRYVAERMCDAPSVADFERQCLLKRFNPDGINSAGLNLDTPPLEPPSGRQYRITVRVTGPKDTRTIVQTLVTRG